LAYLRERQPQIVYNTHPDQRLLTEEEFRKIQEILDHNRSVRGWGFRALKYPLSGLIFCAECGGSCYSLTAGPRGKNRKKRDYYYFQCKNYRMNACSAKKSIRMDAVEQVVVAHLLQKAKKVAELAATPTQPIEPPELQQLQSQLAGLEQLGHNPAIESAKNELRSQIDNLLVKTAVYNSFSQEKQELLLLTFSDPMYWFTLLDDEKRQIYRALIEKVIVREGEVEKVISKV
jgi:hypothetical protein